MADANLSIGIHTSEAERDARKIVKTLNELQSAADKLSDGADFHIDTSELDSDARKIKGTLNDIEREAKSVSSTPVDLKVDSKRLDAFSRSVKKTIREIADSAKAADVAISFDFENPQGEAAELIEKIKREISRNLDRGISVETSLKIVTDAAEAEINRLMTEADGEEIRLPVSADGTERTASEISRLRREAERDGIEIPVSLGSTGGAEDAISRSVGGAGAKGITIPVTTSNLHEVLSKIDKLKDSAEADDIEIEVFVENLSQVSSDIDDLKRRAESSGFEIPASVEDMDFILMEFERLKVRVESRGIEIPVSLDAPESIEDTINKVDGSGSDGIRIPVGLETKKAEQQAGALQDKLSRLLPRNGPTVKIPLDADDATKQADDLADALRGVDDVSDDVNKSSASAAESIKKIEQAAEKAASSVDKFSASLARGLMNEEALELVGEAILVIAESIVTAIVEFENYQDAVEAATGSSESAALAMEMLEDFALNSSASIEDVTAAFVELRTNGLEASKAALTSYGNVAAGLNLTMEEMAQAVGDASARNFSKLNETQLKAKESGDKVIFTYHGVTTEVKNTSAAIAGFIKQMGNTEFAGKMEDQAEGVTGAFEAMSEAWKKLSRDMGEGGLDKGLIDFQQSMAEASREGRELGELFGSWLGSRLETFGEVVVTTVRIVSGLVDMFRDLREMIMSIPVISDVIGGVADMREKIFSGIRDYFPPIAKEDAIPSTPTSPEVSNRAFGTDTETQRTRPRARKTEAQRQQENFEKQFAANDKMIRTLGVMDEAFERGRESVVGMRNEIQDTADRTQLLAQVGEKNVDVIMDQKAAMQGMKESIAYKEEVLSQQEAVAQTMLLTQAYKEGSGAVKDAQASIDAYNLAVQLGVIATPEMVAELESLARAATTANDNLKFEQSMVGFDRQIESAAKMATAFREGGPAIREAAFEQQVYAQAVADGVEEDEAQVDAIRQKMLALRDLKDVQKSDEKAMSIGLDIEQMEREIGLTRLMGEARYMEAARIDMLMNKKRELKDVTAQLTDEELKQADAMGRIQYQSANAGNALIDLAERYGNVNKQMQGVAMGGALALEDSLIDIMTGAKSAREAFADFARTVAEQLMRAAIQMAIIRPLLMGLGGMFAGGGVMTSSGPMDLPKYAKGGIMSPLGDIPLKTYSTGGIANSPQMAIFGEGKMPEAYVPLPDGRRIPVKMEGGGGGGGNAVAITNNISVNMPQNATREQGEQFGDAIARQVEDAMNANLMKQQRPGGLLDPYGYGTG